MKLYYYDSEINFGDMLNVHLLHDLFQMDLIKSDQANCDAVCIGSLLQTFIKPKLSIMEHLHKYISKPVKVWGTGFISPREYNNEILIRRLDISAVRGTLTLERLKNITGKCLKNVVLGDPGLLASRLISADKIDKIYDLGIIPHYVDFNSPLLNNIKVKNSTIIDVKQSVYSFLEQLVSCKTIVSSAMHGLIAADSFGIPNVRMTLSDKIIGGDYKYNDYYSAFGIKEHAVIDLRHREFTDNDIKTITEMYQIKPEQVRQKQNELLKAFPYKIKGKICL